MYCGIYCFNLHGSAAIMSKNHSMCCMALLCSAVMARHVAIVAQLFTTADSGVCSWTQLLLVSYNSMMLKHHP